MGIGYTIDTPIKIAKFGISSVISLVDDSLIERMRELYSNKMNFKFSPISNKDFDYRAKRITAYLNLVNEIVTNQLEELKRASFTAGSQLVDYFELLPDNSTLKISYLEMLNIKDSVLKFLAQKKLKKELVSGDIDVNIMTKLDKSNVNANKEALPIEYNDAHAAIRGFANSTLTSSVVFSAGMNPRLYSYMNEFEDFFPDRIGEIKKQIILKVSDYRSAFVQGKILAKKGIWISEYRIESGLNCGGHAFPTQGHLLGPILEEFKTNRKELEKTTLELYYAALESLNKNKPNKTPSVKVSAQGGIGEANEQEFLSDYYNLKDTGWGSPFLLVPEVVSIDNNTISLLSKAKEKDFYLSDISPLGIRINSIKGNTKDLEKEAAIAKGKPGTPCIKKILVSNKEFSVEPLCTASRKYQAAKIKELKSQDLKTVDFQKAFDKVVEKACICVGLGTSTLLVNNLEHKLEGTGVSICPGPNLAYFSNSFSLKEMVNHIYGRIDILNQQYRPHMFIKELDMYITYFKEQLNDLGESITPKQVKYFDVFKDNLINGIAYYQVLVGKMKKESAQAKEKISSELFLFEKELLKLGTLNS